MNFLFFFLPLILGLIQFGHSSDVGPATYQNFIEILRNNFQSIEKGDNATLNFGIVYYAPGKAFNIKYKFCTRNGGHWASIIEITNNFDERFIKQVHRSLFMNRKLYSSSIGFPSELSFLQDVLVKGPQITLFIDEYIQENGSEISKESSSKGDLYRFKRIIGSDYLEMQIGINKVFRLSYDVQKHTKFYQYLFNLKNQTQDDIFKITEDLVLIHQTSILVDLFYNTGLFMGTWDLLNG